MRITSTPPHSSFSRAEPREATAHDEQLATQALVRARRRRKSKLIVIGLKLDHLSAQSSFLVRTSPRCLLPSWRLWRVWLPPGSLVRESSHASKLQPSATHSQTRILVTAHQALLLQCDR